MRLGVVVIGRNEGERLRRCLSSVGQKRWAVVYVDSGSSDGSVATARLADVEVVELDHDVAFTAGRARNEGFHRLLDIDPSIEVVQFVDGDCTLVDGWLDRAMDALVAQQNAAVVCGRLVERSPEASFYNRLCDMEWNLPSGETKQCGGIFAVRADAFEQVGLFSPDLVAGEEPELCYRLRQVGWKITRLADPMALHDADMSRFGQWCRRMVRGGFAFAEGASMYGRSRERYCVRESISIWFWAFLLPTLAIGLAYPTNGISLALVAAFPLFAARIAWRRRQRIKDAWSNAWIYAIFCILAKWPQLIGQWKFLLWRALGRRSRLIECKPVPSAGDG